MFGSIYKCGLTVINRFFTFVYSYCGQMLLVHIIRNGRQKIFNEVLLGFILRYTQKNVGYFKPGNLLKGKSIFRYFFLLWCRFVAIVLRHAIYNDEILTWQVLQLHDWLWNCTGDLIDIGKVDIISFFFKLNFALLFIFEWQLTFQYWQQVWPKNAFDCFYPMLNKVTLSHCI